MSNSGNAQPAAAVTYEKRSDGTHIFRFSNTRRETIDHWQTLMHDAMDHNPPGRHFRILCDVHGLWISPYIMRVAVALSRYSPRDLPASTAVVMNDSLGISLVQTLFNQLAQHSVRARRVFTSEVDALDWIEKRDRQFAPNSTDDGLPQ